MTSPTPWLGWTAMSPTLKDCRAGSVFTVDCIPPPDYDGVTPSRRARVLLDVVQTESGLIAPTALLSPCGKGPFLGMAPHCSTFGSLTLHGSSGQLACNLNACLSALISLQ